MFIVCIQSACIVSKELSANDTWEIVKPVCRELFELVNEGMVKFVSAVEKTDGTFIINLESSRIHLASRNFKDSIGDIEYDSGQMRIGLRANGRPGNIFVKLT